MKIITKAIYFLSLSLILAAMASSCASSSAHKGTVISGEISDAANIQAFLDKITLVNQSNVIQKVDIDAKGNFEFAFDEMLAEGIYRLRIGAKRTYLVLGPNDKHLSMKGSLNDMVTQNLVYEGSKTAVQFADVKRDYMKNPGNINGAAQKIALLESPYAAILAGMQIFGGREEYLPPPVITAITTASSKVALNQEITFQIITHPVNQYDNCTVDLSGARNASIISNIDPTTGRFSLRFNKASSSDNDTQLIKVSNSQGKADIAVTVSLMKLFWHHHPGRKNVCDETLFVNQCAIRMGTALELSGIKMSQDRRVLRRCTTEYRAFKHHKEGLVHGHVLAAQELANWIKSQTSTFGRRSVVQTKEEIMGRSGVIFFRDGWGTTDHIDVWDGEALVGGFPSYFDSDFKELWFWDVY